MNEEEFVALFTDGAAYATERSVNGLRCSLKLLSNIFVAEALIEADGEDYFTRLAIPFWEVYRAGSFRGFIDKAIAENERYIAHKRAAKQRDHAAPVTSAPLANYVTRTPDGLIPARTRDFT